MRKPCADKAADERAKQGPECEVPRDATVDGKDNCAGESDSKADEVFGGVDLEDSFEFRKAKDGEHNEAKARAKVACIEANGQKQGRQDAER